MFTRFKKQLILGAVFLGMLGSLFQATSHADRLPSVTLEPQQMERPNAEITYLRIPAHSAYEVLPIVSQKLEVLPDLVAKFHAGAIAAINAGYFDPANHETISYVVQDGKLIANPVDNRNFVENPDLYPYITQMLNRSEFRVLDCHGKRVYSIAKHRDPLKFRCKLVHSLQAGPDLFDSKALEAEAFVAFKKEKRIRDPLGIDRKNARSALGLDDEGNVILAMAAMKPFANNEVTGVTLSEMATIMQELGAMKALSLDGGSSTSFWFSGETCYGKLDKSSNPVKRPIKSALVVAKRGEKRP